MVAFSLCELLIGKGILGPTAAMELDRRMTSTYVHVHGCHVLGCLRLIFFEYEVQFWTENLIVLPIHVALLFLPLSMPVMAVTADMISLARLLTTLETLQSRHEHGPEPTPKGPSGSTDNSIHRTEHGADVPAEPSTPHDRTPNAAMNRVSR